MFGELNARHEARKADRAWEILMITTGICLLAWIAFTLSDTNKMIKVLTCNALNDTPDSFSHCLDNE